jgi:hypothetical protein
VPTFEKLIVGFDGTDTGWDGLVLSIALAKTFGSQLDVAYVYDQELAASSREAARELAEHAGAVLAGAREGVSQALAVSFRGLPATSAARGLHELAMHEAAGPGLAVSWRRLPGGAAPMADLRD